MTLSLHSLQQSRGSIKKRKRLGRGNASGHGTYSTRGLKGQKARTGGKNKLKRLGFKKILQALPKKRGFKSGRPKNQVVNLKDINHNFKEGELINPLSLFRLGLVKKNNIPVKILGQGNLEIKDLVFEGVEVSENVKIQIEKLGGKIEVSGKN